jgi:hypothetical protein
MPTLKSMSTEIVPRSSEWYKALAEECHAIVVEKTKIAHQELTEMYLMLGARILEESRHASITRLVEAVSVDVRIGKANLWYAVAVVKKYGDDVNKLPIEGASISWNKAKKLITTLPAGVEQPSDSFDPYGFAGHLCQKQSPASCRIVASEILRILRERR